jgi:hypothetical protein
MPSREILSDPEYRAKWIHDSFEEIAAVWGRGKAETLEMALSMDGDDDRLLLRWLPGEWTEIGWVPPNSLPQEGHTQIGEVLAFYERARPWWWADWILTGEHQWGSMYDSAADLSGRSYDTLAGYVWTGRRFELERRRIPPIFYSHHAKLAPRRYTEPQQDAWLNFLERQVRGGKKISVSDLGRMLDHLPKPPKPADPIFEWVQDWKAEEEFKKREKQMAKEMDKKVSAAVKEAVAKVERAAKERPVELVSEKRDDHTLFEGLVERQGKYYCPHCGAEIGR